MRFLHTSDWHLGRSFHRVSLLTAQRAFLDHLVETVGSREIDAVLVAGDIYDRAVPPLAAVQLFDEALHRLAGLGVPTVMISGNHDSDVLVKQLVRQGAIVLTQAVEAVAGQRLNDFLAARLFGPLGMTSTRFLPPESEFLHQFFVAALLIGPDETDGGHGTLLTPGPSPSPTD